MNTKHILSLIASPLLLVSSLSAQVNFSGIDWFTGLDPIDYPLDVSGGSMTSDLPSNASATIVGYFAPAGSPISIGVGQAMRLEYTISYSGTVLSNGGMRVGLFNTDMTPGARITDDGFGLTHASFSGTPNPRGAATWHDNMTEDGAINIRRRNTSSSSNIVNSASQYSAANAVTSGNTLSEAIVANREYHTVFEIWNDGLNDNRFVARQWYMDGIDEVVIYDIVFDSQSDLTYANSFDTVVFRLIRNGDSFTVSDLSISVIPEPATWALILGLGGMGVVLLRRRR